MAIYNKHNINHKKRRIWKSSNIPRARNPQRLFKNNIISHYIIVAEFPPRDETRFRKHKVKLKRMSKRFPRSFKSEYARVRAL